jgi:hypothetical protein
MNEIINVLTRNSKGLEGAKKERLSFLTAFPFKYLGPESNLPVGRQAGNSERTGF